MNNHRSPVVLWAEDDPEQKAWIKEALHTNFPQVNLVARDNGLEALDYLMDATFLDSPPDLIVLDIHMPHVDGKNALISIVCNPDLKETPVVFFSASENKMDQMFSRMYEVPLFRKPADAPSFKQVVKDIVQQFCISEYPCNRESLKPADA